MKRKVFLIVLAAVLCFAATQHLDGQIGRTDGHIQHMVHRWHLLHGLTTPAFVNIERQTMVQSVVGTRYSVK